MSKSRQREISAMIRTAGLTVIELSVTGGNHYSGLLMAPNEATRRFVFSNSPSDRRGDLNRLSHLRRFSKENQSAVESLHE